MDLYGKSSTGKSGVNADSYFMSEENQVYVIADGASGSKNKVLAGEICTQSVQDELLHLSSLEADVFNEKCIERANKKLIEQSQKDQGLHFATMMICTIKNDVLYTSSVGDSVTYLVHDGKIEKITLPRKKYSTLVDLGILQEADIIESIGKLPPELWSVYEFFLPMIVLDIFKTKRQVYPGDTLIMCTDGISDWISDAEIKNIVTEEKNAESCVQRIFETVNKNCPSDKKDDQTLIIKKI